MQTRLAAIVAAAIGTIDAASAAGSLGLCGAAFAPAPRRAASGASPRR
jgi:hypothetical protein